jgi:hypothetical protein
MHKFVTCLCLRAANTDLVAYGSVVQHRDAVPRPASGGFLVLIRGDNFGGLNAVVMVRAPPPLHTIPTTQFPPPHRHTPLVTLTVARVDVAMLITKMLHLVFASVPAGRPALPSNIVIDSRICCPRTFPCACGVQVTVAGFPCRVLPDVGARSHEHVVCAAPPRSLGVPSTLTVTVADQSSQGVDLAYDGPFVLRVVRACEVGAP